MISILLKTILVHLFHCPPLSLASMLGIAGTGPCGGSGPPSRNTAGPSSSQPAKTEPPTAEDPVTIAGPSQNANGKVEERPTAQQASSCRHLSPQSL